MKKIAILLLCLCIGLSAQVKRTDPKVLVLMHPHDTFITPAQSVIILDVPSYVKYEYTAHKFDTLKSEVRRMDAALQKQDSIQQEIRDSYEGLLVNKEQQIGDYQNSYDRVKENFSSLAEKQSKLEADYVRLQQKHSRAKKWRNIFLGSTAALTGILVLVVTH